MYKQAKDIMMRHLITGEEIIQSAVAGKKINNIKAKSGLSLNDLMLKWVEKFTLKKFGLVNALSSFFKQVCMVLSITDPWK